MSSSQGSPGTVSFVCEIPRGATAKLEVQKKVPHNPIMQDTKKGALRYYTYGAPFFNYGMLPQVRATRLYACVI